MITEEQKKQVWSLIEAEKRKLSSYTKVANKLGISTATVTNNMRNRERWGFVSDSVWIRAGKILGFSFKKSSWNIVDTNNSRLMHSVLNLAQTEAMFIGISERAGSGKSTGILSFRKADETDSVYTLQCEEWTRKQFLIQLTQNIGQTPKRSDSVQTLSDNFISAMKEKSAVSQPVLILDEADKLRPSALRFLIHFYNQLEDEVGLVICGTENLEKEIKKGVEKATKGYDEIDSRLGRNFVHLQGVTLEDARSIAIANGLSSEGQIKKVWAECDPRDRRVGNRYIPMVSDLRRLKRVIQRERKMQTFN